ncbi:hypothetical protein [Prosthecobacter sp.]|jgi:hypothetical protein|uniref:hypothetical protein n=1 Tax=Prosthecobacter sp. TaxID=1965333 RepID=UPI0037845F4A
MTSGCNCLTNDKPSQPHLIHVFLLGAGLWRWRAGWGQVRTARRLDPRAAVVEGRVICGGVKLQSVVAF